MKLLYPPSGDRISPRTERRLDALVHDVTKVEPGSVQHAALNVFSTELERILNTVTLDHTEPSRADVRQVGSVMPASNEPEAETSSRILYGPPTDLSFTELRRIDVPGEPIAGAHSGAVRNDGALIIRVQNQIFAVKRSDGPIPDISVVESDAAGTIVRSSEPGVYTIAGVPGTEEGVVATQTNGLDVYFAGIGTFDIRVEFTGVADYVYDANLPAVGQRPEFEYLNRPLNMYDANGKDVAYEELAGGIINIIGKTPDGTTYRLYYEGVYEERKSYAPRNAVAKTVDNVFSMDPISEYATELPQSGDITCTQVKDLLTVVAIQDARLVEITRSGFVGNVQVGHPISHALAGLYHIFVLDKESGSLTLVEPESGRTYSYSVPPNTFAITWLPNKRLGLIRLAESNTSFIVEQIEENRTLQQQNLTPTRL